MGGNTYPILLCDRVHTHARVLREGTFHRYMSFLRHKSSICAYSILKSFYLPKGDLIYLKSLQKNISSLKGELQLYFSEILIKHISQSSFFLVPPKFDIVYQKIFRCVLFYLGIKIFKIQWLSMKILVMYVLKNTFRESTASYMLN